MVDGGFATTTGTAGVEVENAALEIEGAVKELEPD